jgi:ATP-binding cassette subfamily B protein
MIKKLLGCVREYKKHSILAPVLISFEVVMEVIIPILMANLIDYGIDKGDISTVNSLKNSLSSC